MLYKAQKRLIEAKNDEEAEKILGTRDFRRYRKPTEKEFMMWVWLRCGKKDGKVIKLMLGERAPFLEEYAADPRIVRRELKAAGIWPEAWVMMGEEGYDQEEHGELFYQKGIEA